LTSARDNGVVEIRHQEHGENRCEEEGQTDILVVKIDTRMSEERGDYGVSATRHSDIEWSTTKHLEVTTQAGWQPVFKIMQKTRDSYIREVWLNFRIGKNRMKRRFVAVLARDVQGGVALGLKPFPQVLGVILTANATVEQARHLSVH
jgi:hypothetical protein